MNQIPTEGRIVRYVLTSGPNAGIARPAIITNVINESAVSITAFPDAALDGVGVTFSAVNVKHDADKKPGTWHWPEQLAQAA